MPSVNSVSMSVSSSPKANLFYLPNPSDSTVVHWQINRNCHHLNLNHQTITEFHGQVSFRPTLPSPSCTCGQPFWDLSRYSAVLLLQCNVYSISAAFCDMTSVSISNIVTVSVAIRRAVKPDITNGQRDLHVG